MLIENVEIFGFKSALRGMRNAFNSWNKSDSSFHAEGLKRYNGIINFSNMHVPETPYIGNDDLKLALSLIASGSSHRKFLRQIMIWFDLSMPRYVWTEFDTYKVGVVRNSCSTMHKITSRKLTKNDFSEHLKENNYFDIIINIINSVIEKYNDKESNIIDKNYYFNQLKALLPEGFIQKATISMNYENALNIYFQRRNHKLQEWHIICDFITTLPFMGQFINAIKA